MDFFVPVNSEDKNNPFGKPQEQDEFEKNPYGFTEEEPKRGVLLIGDS